MKKSLSKAIVLSAAILGFAVTANKTTVKAAEVTDDTPTETQSSVPVTEEDSSTTDSIEDNSSSEETTDSKDEVQTNDSNIISQQKATNRTNVVADGFPVVEIRPTEEAIKANNLANVDDPASEGELLVPYTYHGNGSVYVLDENNQPILDPNDETGYKTRSENEIYAQDPDFRDVSAPFTGTVYGVIYGPVKDADNLTVKEKMLKALGREGAFYMQGRNHGYSNSKELSIYRDAFLAKLAEINALNDDGTSKAVIETDPIIETNPVTEPTTSNHGSSSNHANTNATTGENNLVVNNNDEEIDLNIKTIKSADLFTKDGKNVTDRGLANESIWHVNEVGIVNGEIMYRISDNEWVSSEDVQIID